MKILFDHQIYIAQKFGGISRYFNELAKTQDGNVFIEQIDPALFDIPEPVAVKTDIVSRSIRFAKRKAGLTHAVKIAGFPEEVKQILNLGDFDIFHPTYYNPYFLEYTDKPFVLTVYDMIHEIYKEYFQISDATSYNKIILCHKAKHIIAISEKTKQDLIEIFGIPEEKISVILLASDFGKVSAIPPSNAEILGKYILFVGNRGAYKNFYYPIMAIADILKEDKDLQLVCTGNSFSAEEIVFFNSLGIGSQVIHVYMHNDNELAWVYQHAQLFIFPSLYEGFGFPLLEAFASNCPVVSSNGGSLPEVGGKGALYFNPKDISDIRNTVYQGIYNTGVRNMLIESGKDRLNNFSWQKCREETINVYNKVLSLS
jgi:glycosyltransferase involved in cell wall biosynthesis